MSLNQLDTAVQTQAPNIQQDVQEEMTVNVKKLKRQWQFLVDLDVDLSVDDGIEELGKAYTCFTSSVKGSANK